MSYYRFAERLAPSARGVAQGGEFDPLVLKQKNKKNSKQATTTSSSKKEANKNKPPGIVLSADLWNPLSSQFNLISEYLATERLCLQNKVGPQVSTCMHMCTHVYLRTHACPPIRMYKI